MTDWLQKGENMGVGAVTSSNYQTDYRGYEATGNTKIDAFYNNMSSAVEKSETKGTEKVLGLTAVPYSDMMSYAMTATYSEASTDEDPIIRISSGYGGEKRYYDVHVNEVNPSNASQLEMFALSCYQDDKGITDRGTFGSYTRMKSYAWNASDLGNFPDLQDPANAGTKLDWISMLKEMSQLYFGIPEAYSQGLDANKLADTLTKWKENIYNKLMSGETEVKIQIGGQALTQKEWDQLLVKFDSEEEKLRKLVEEETKEKIKEKIEKKIEEKKDKEEESKIQSEILTSNSIVSVSGEQYDEKTMHITWVTEEGIFCRKAGQTEGYEWSIRFDDKEPYDKAVELLNTLTEENLKYASDQSIWKRYLNGEVALEDLVAYPLYSSKLIDVTSDIT